MSMLPLVSIIVPVYNTGDLLKRNVESLKNQTYENIEIVLVDDGSTDGVSGQLCDTLAADDERIRVVHKENGGLVSAWKCGTKESKGSYLTFVDSDDWVEVTMIAEMKEKLAGGCKEIISSDYIIERDNGNNTEVYQSLAPGVYDREALTLEVFPILLGKEHRSVTLSRCMKLISRELVEENMHFADERCRMGEDLTIMLPALMDCERLVVMDHKIYYHYLLISESMAHKYDRGLYDSICLLRQVIAGIIEDKFAADKEMLAHMMECADKEFLLLLFLVLKNESRGNAQGYKENIKAVCNLPEIKALIADRKLEISDKSNILLYTCMKHPNNLFLWVLRLAMKVYYRS